MSVIAIVGSRYFNDYEVLKTEMNKFDIEKIVSGGAKGADLLAEQYGREHNIPVEVHKPDWKLGLHAGILRNKVIVDHSDAVVAFWNGESYGTLSTIKHAKKTGKQVTIVNIKNNKFEESVKIRAEYSGVADYTKASEFYLNSTFQEDFKKYSSTLSTPLVENSQTPSYWFYESVMGEYLASRVNLTVAEQRQFDVENPKEQMFNTSDLARNELAWLQEPFIAIDYSILGKSVFAHYLADALEKNKLAINEVYFKRAVAKLILRKYVEDIILKNEWYIGHSINHTLAYTIAYVSYLVSKTRKSLDFDQIWNSQSAPNELEEIINITAREIQQFLLLPKEGYFTRGAWHKQEECWNQIKALPLDIKIPDSLLVEQSAYF